MNVKDSHCMSRVRYILLLCLLVCSMAVSAQTFSEVERNSFWQGSQNVAGIRLDSLSRSYAEAFGRYEEGGFRDTWQAPRTWSAGAVTESVRHFERMSVTGSFAFEQTEGYDMCGSMFIKPGYFPIDVLEFTPGRKTLQTYSFDGGIAYDLDGRWTIGAKMDFESANLAKRKDLRHANWWLDFTVAPGVMYRSGDWAVGLSPVFRKVAETIDAEQVGTAESSYYAFLDKGLMYGIHQVWTGSGIHLEESGVNGLPLREYSYGGAAQMQYRGLFAEVQMSRTYGSAGEKEYMWFKFPGMKMDTDLRYRWTVDDRESNVRLHYDMKRQHTDETVLEKISENGITTVLNHGSNRIFSKSSWRISPEYEMLHRIMDMRAGADFEVSEGVSSQVYPYIYARSLKHLSAYVEIMFHYGRLDFGAKGTYGTGWLKESERLASEGSGVQSVPFRLQEWYERQMEYMTARRFHADLMLRYNFSRGIYIAADIRSTKAFDLDHSDDPNRFSATVKVGYDF